MITRFISSHLLSRAINSVDLNSIYRPLQWRPSYVLSERRKAVIRSKYLSLAIWSFVALLFILMLVLISNVAPKVSAPGIISPANSIQMNQGIETQPAKTSPVIEYMTDEEWQKMKEDTYGWLGC